MYLCILLCKLLLDNSYVFPGTYIIREERFLRHILPVLFNASWQHTAAYPSVCASPLMSSASPPVPEHRALQAPSACAAWT